MTDSHIAIVPAVSPAEMIDLIHDARLVVINGGATLGHALSLGKVAISVPLANDQHRRIARCSALGLLVAGVLDAGKLSRAVISLLEDPERQRAIERRVSTLEVTNGVPRALDAIERLLTKGRERGARG